MDIQNVINALQDYHQGMVDSDPTVQELRAEVERLKEELSSSTNHYNGIINDLVKLRDEALAERDRLKTELVQAISERTPHDYGILRDQRDDYREKLGAACKEVSELNAKVKLLTKERDKERANFEVLRKDSNKWHMQERDDYWEEVFRMRSQIDGWRTRCEIAEQNCKPFLQVRPEPSRLEIAAMIYSAFAGAQCIKDKVNPTAFIAFKCADELIAAAKEVTK